MEQQPSINTPLPANNTPEHGPPPDINTNRKKIIITVVVVILLIAAGVATVFFTRNNNRTAGTGSNPNTHSQSNDPFAQQYLQGCKDRAVSFTQSPVPLDQLGGMEPMGKVYDGHVTPTDHMYVVPRNPQAADNTFDVVMPADGTVTLVGAMPAEYIGDSNKQTAPEDHRIAIAHNCQYVSIFIHVHQLSPALQQVVGALKPNEQKQVSIELKAGDKIGKIGGNAVDWTLADARKTVSGFVTPDLYKGEPWKVHVIDPFTVYSGNLKTQLIAKAYRSVEPYGGKIDYDKKGALIGNWFRQNTNGYAGASQDRYWDGHLSIAPNYIDPSATVFSIGNWQGKAAQFTVKGAVDPSAVTVKSGAVKYELIDTGYMAADGMAWSGMTLTKGLKVSQSDTVRGTALLQVEDGEKLKLELFPGKTADQVSAFTAAARTYVR